MALAPGKPSMFTEERRKKIIDAVAEGNYRTDAAEMAGINPGTLQSWLRRGRKEKSGEYFIFLMAIVTAENSVKTRCIKGVLDAGMGDAKHYEWYLERKFPEQWGKDRLQIKQLEARMAELEAREAANRVAHRTHGTDGKSTKKKRRHEEET